MRWDSAERRAPGAGPPGPGVRGIRRALVVEDDALIAGLWTDVLAVDGFDVRRMETALGAAAVVRRWRPDVLVLDLGLPYRSGASLLAELKADPLTAGVPVVVVSAAPESLNESRRSMASAVLAKPVSLQLLRSTIGAACGATVGRPRGVPR